MSHPEYKPPPTPTLFTKAKVAKGGMPLLTDISKFLRFTGEKLNWLNVVDPHKVKNYLEYLEERCGVDKATKNLKCLDVCATGGIFAGHYGNNSSLVQKLCCYLGAQKVYLEHNSP